MATVQVSQLKLYVVKGPILSVSQLKAYVVLEPIYPQLLGGKGQGGNKGNPPPGQTKKQFVSGLPRSNIRDIGAYRPYSHLFRPVAASSTYNVSAS